MKLKGEVPPVRLSTIDYVACSIVNSTPTGAAAPQSDVASDVLCELAVRFVDEVDALAWAVEHVPDAVEEQDGDFRYVRVPIDGGTIDATYLAQRDAHTIVATYNLERMRQLMAAGRDNVLAEQWASVDGGLVTLAFHPERMVDGDASAGQALAEAAQMFVAWGVAEGQPDPLGTAFRTIGDGTKSVCLGLDLDPQTGDVAVRGALACPDYATAKNVRASFQLLQEFLKEYMRVVGAAVMPNAGDAFAQMYVDTMLLAGRTFGETEFDFRLRDDDAVDVWFEVRGALPTSLQQYLAALNALGDDMVQPAAAVAPAAAPADSGQE